MEYFKGERELQMALGLNNKYEGFICCLARIDALVPRYNQIL